ncbi:hypothetical protein NDU88_003515 [Pleurodeles waltl]|uniref:Uncharacterized protein n=1 Tax=Pleurodeles waltl TaxID=8319 RepID=A0AAV7W6E3_PLEWA|nr:hypothetical protein NDU88_003515 [Pleurodeles waltl]
MQILATIEASSANFQAKIDSVSMDVNLLHADLHKVAKSLLETEQYDTKLQEEVQALQTKVTTLTAQMYGLEMRAEDSGGHSQRCNLQFVGFSEGAKRTTPELFLEQWLRKTLPGAPLSTVFIVERAHRHHREGL